MHTLSNINFLCSAYILGSDEMVFQVWFQSREMNTLYIVIYNL